MKAKAKVEGSASARMDDYRAGQLRNRAETEVREVRTWLCGLFWTKRRVR